MKRSARLLALGGALLLAAACASAPPGSVTPTLLSPGGALVRLCDPSEATSLPAIANQLEQLRASDTTPLQAAMATMLGDLQTIDVDTSSQPVRDTTVTAVESLQQVIADPATRGPAAAQAAAALRSMRAEIC